MWEIDINDQLITFLLSLALGAVICILYDIMRALNKNGGGVFSVFFRDLIFWVLTAFLTFFFLLSRTNGEIRGYVLFTAGVGFLICRLTFSRILLPVLTKLFHVIKVASSAISQGIGRFSDMFVSFLYLILRKTALFFKFIAKYAKKLLKSIRYMLYTKQDKKSVKKAL